MNKRHFRFTSIYARQHPRFVGMRKSEVKFKRNRAVRQLYWKFHFKKNYRHVGMSGGLQVEIHHIIPLKEREHGIGSANLDVMPNFICVKKALHDILSFTAQNDKRYYRIHFTDNWNKVKFSETRDSTDFLDFNGQTEFLNGGLVSYNPVYAPFIQTYNHFFIDDYNANQLKRKS